MNEAEKRRWDVLLAVVAPLLTVATIIVGLWQFNKGEEDRQRQETTSNVERDRIEFRRRLWLEKLQVYKQIADIAGEVVAAAAAEGGRTASEQTYQHFLQAYWGAMILVEDKDVEKAMILFQADLIDYRSGWNKDSNRLKERADLLIAACRKDIEADGQTLGSIPN